MERQQRELFALAHRFKRVLTSSKDSAASAQVLALAGPDVCLASRHSVRDEYGRDLLSPTVTGGGSSDGAASDAHSSDGKSNGGTTGTGAGGASGAGDPATSS